MDIASTLDPDFLAALDDLDRGVFSGPGVAADEGERPPLTAMLVMPCPPRLAGRAPRAALKLRVRRGAVGVMTAWAASWMVLVACLSASAAGFAFHVELSDMIGRWEHRLAAPEAPGPNLLTAVNTIEISRGER